MTINNPMDKYIALAGATDDGTTLSWVATSTQTVASPSTFGVRDFNEDGDMDIGEDYWLTVPTDGLFTGYIISVGGNDYGVFNLTGVGYFVPFQSSFDDITTTFPDAGSTSTRSDNALVANCFLSGTLIATPTGEKSIETLTIGDLLLSTDGRVVSIKWIARQTVKNSIFLSERFEPVKIAAGALGDSLPLADLTVSADHGLILDGMIVNASALVNNDTIRFVPLADLPDTFTYWHIECANHEVIFANGALSETYLDATGRAVFDNYDEYLHLYGAETLIPENPLPRITSRRLLPDALKTKTGGKPDLPEFDFLRAG